MIIRPPAVSGTFYPADPTLLSLQVDRLLEGQEPHRLSGSIVGIVAPHAGYMYSGYTAASVYAQLRGRGIRTAVIVSPSHREYFNGISIYEGDAYRTPLGIVEVDKPLRERLLKHKGAFMLSKFGHRDEHAIEVQLPFLQRVNEDVKILPIVMGDQRGELCSMLGDILGEAVDRDDVVIIASSDLSHMYEGAVANAMDAVASDDIAALSSTALLQHLASGKTEACGGGPVSAVMHASMLRGADTATVLHRCTSGDATGDQSRVVGYLSAAFTRSARQDRND